MVSHGPLVTVASAGAGNGVDSGEPVSVASVPHAISPGGAMTALADKIRKARRFIAHHRLAVSRGSGSAIRGERAGSFRIWYRTGRRQTNFSADRSVASSLNSVFRASIT